MTWHLSPLVWKRIIGQKCTFEDLDHFDSHQFQFLKDIKKHGSELKPEEFEVIVDEFFVTQLTDGKKFELCQDGESKKVTQDNYQEFIDLVIKARLNEAQKQMEWLREGIQEVIDLSILEILQWEDVEIRACGPKNISIDRLKKFTEYISCSESDQRIVNFWKMLEGFT